MVVEGSIGGGGGGGGGKGSSSRSFLLFLRTGLFRGLALDLISIRCTKLVGETPFEAEGAPSGGTLSP